MRRSIDLEFGEQKLKIRPLTIGQMEKIEALLLKQDLKDPKAGLTNVQLSREVITVALSRDHTTVEATDLECDLTSLAAAMNAIMQHGGFVPGEVKPAGQNAPTGAPSEGAS